MAPWAISGADASPLGRRATPAQPCSPGALYSAGVPSAPASNSIRAPNSRSIPGNHTRRTRLGTDYFPLLPFWRPTWWFYRPHHLSGWLGRGGRGEFGKGVLRWWMMRSSSAVDSQGSDAFRFSSRRVGAWSSGTHIDGEERGTRFCTPGRLPKCRIGPLDLIRECNRNRFFKLRLWKVLAHFSWRTKTSEQVHTLLTLS